MVSKMTQTAMDWLDMADRLEYEAALERIAELEQELRKWRGYRDSLYRKAATRRWVVNGR